MSVEDQLRTEAANQPYPLIFITISGAHLYGFASADSDYDLRGCHVLPFREVAGLDSGRETIEISKVEHGLELDLVTHDARKFFAMMLKKNGYVLEQLYSPLIVQTTLEHAELREIGRLCVTRHHSHHYFGFAETQWRLFQRDQPRRVKPLLYTYRTLLTGVHLMRTGEVEANLVRLNDERRIPELSGLIDRKTGGHERETLADEEFTRFERLYEQLRGELEAAYQASQLPDGPSARPALNDLLVRLRTGS